MSSHCIVSSTISQGLRDDRRQNDVDKPQSVTQAMSAYVACPTNDNATVRALIAPRPPNIDINESSGVLPSITRPRHLNFKELCSKFRYAQAITYSARCRDVPLSFATNSNVWSIPHTRILSRIIAYPNMDSPTLTRLHPSPLCH